MRRAPVLIGLLALAGPAIGQVRPEPGPGDPRLQTIRYVPDQVVELPVAGGTAVMVSFAGGERVETVALGDSGGWSVTPTKRGDAIFVKALAGTDTNMTVITDARTYLFQLTGSIGGAAPLVVRFSYAEPERLMPPVAATAPAYRYRFTGPRALRPSSIVATGTTTAISWPKDAALPAVFRLDDDGAETLVNGEMQDDRFVLEGQPKTLVFRLGKLRGTAHRVAIRRRDR